MSRSAARSDNCCCSVTVRLCTANTSIPVIPAIESYDKTMHRTSPNHLDEIAHPKRIPTFYAPMFLEAFLQNTRMPNYPRLILNLWSQYRMQGFSRHFVKLFVRQILERFNCLLSDSLCVILLPKDSDTPIFIGISNLEATGSIVICDQKFWLCIPHNFRTENFKLW